MAGITRISTSLLLTLLLICISCNEYVLSTERDDSSSGEGQIEVRRENDVFASGPIDGDSPTVEEETNHQPNTQEEETFADTTTTQSPMIAVGKENGHLEHLPRVEDEDNEEEEEEEENQVQAVTEENMEQAEESTTVSDAPVAPVPPEDPSSSSEVPVENENSSQNENPPTTEDSNSPSNNEGNVENSIEESRNEEEVQVKETHLSISPDVVVVESGPDSQEHHVEDEKKHDEEKDKIDDETAHRSEEKKPEEKNPTQEHEKSDNPDSQQVVSGKSSLVFVNPWIVVVGVVLSSLLLSGTSDSEEENRWSSRPESRDKFGDFRSCVKPDRVDWNGKSIYPVI